jgi:ubiquinone/menaquinone biosynthesis C-methylase UbiE
VGKCLGREEIRSFYNRMGAKQDWQRFYEAPAISELRRNARFESAVSVFELGCGTGSFAFELLKNRLSATASYVGADISPVMAGLARKKLAFFGDRAKILLTDGSLVFNYPPEFFDRFVANYVMDLLPSYEINMAIDEAHRLIKPGGFLCLISLTYGGMPLSRAVTRLWRRLYAKNPGLLGGCRPLRLQQYLREGMWQVVFRRVVHSFGIASEVVVALKLS